MWIFIVRRECREVFETLRRHFQDNREVRVLLDRRVGERRVGPAILGYPEQRRAARRRPTPWSSLGYAVVAGEQRLAAPYRLMPRDVAAAFPGRSR